jgi:hypothetical protein
MIASLFFVGQTKQRQVQMRGRTDPDSGQVVVAPNARCALHVGMRASIAK